MQYATKLYANKNNLTYQIVFNHDFAQFQNGNPTAIAPFGARILPHLRSANIAIELIADNNVINRPLWTIPKPIVNTHLTESTKEETNPSLYKAKFGELKERHQEYKFIFTDGSKLDEKAAASIVTENNIFKTRLPNGSSIFSAEVRGLQLAMEIVKISRYKKFMICVDSLSVLQSIENLRISNPLIKNLITRYDETIKFGKEVIFCWVPSHVGIPGNEAADRAAKEALDKEISEFFIPATDFSPYILKYTKELWQILWDEQVNNKLHYINPVVGRKRPTLKNVRDNMVMHRIRIGHTYTTHKYLLRKDPPPECIPCQARYTVKHILLDCAEFEESRSRHFDVRSLKELFDKTEPCTILEFLKEIQLYDYI